MNQGSLLKQSFFSLLSFSFLIFGGGGGGGGGVNGFFVHFKKNRTNTHTHPV